MDTCLGKSCSFGLLCVSFVNVYQSVCVLSLLVLRVGCGIWLYYFLIIAFLFTFLWYLLSLSVWLYSLNVYIISSQVQIISSQHF